MPLWLQVVIRWCDGGGEDAGNGDGGDGEKDGCVRGVGVGISGRGRGRVTRDGEEKGEFEKDVLLYRKSVLRNLTCRDIWTFRGEGI